MATENRTPESSQPGSCPLSSAGVSLRQGVEPRRSPFLVSKVGPAAQGPREMVR